MNLLIKALVLYVCLISVSCNPFFRRDPNLRDLVDKLENKVANAGNNTLQEIEKTIEQAKTLIEKVLPEAEQKNKTANNTVLNRNKRQVFGPLQFAGGFGVGFGAYDYNDYYGDYASDYLYDYYDWVCSDTTCQLCNILGGECCDPDDDPNCFLPDSCLNNPCLAGGTCITTRTIDNRPDFICVCLPGLGGKYCQLANDYLVGADIFDLPPPPVPIPPPQPYQQPYQQPAPVYQQPAPAPVYQQPAPAPVYQQPAPAPVYQQPAPAPVYEQPAAPAPVYQQPAPAPVYQQPAPAPVYQQPPPAPVYQQQQPY